MPVDLRPGEADRRCTAARTSRDRDEVIAVPAREPGGHAVGLHLFGGPFVTVDGLRRRIPDCAERLMVWLALRRGSVDRGLTAGVLWPLVDDRRAAGNLRSALWRLRGAGFDVVEADNASVSLRQTVTVDVRLAAEWAERLLTGRAWADDLAAVPWFADSLTLLTGWDDDWVVLERERLRQRMLHAFEELSRLLGRTGRCAEAVDVARTVVAADPLRESAQRALLQAHLADGDPATALRVVDAYARLHVRTFGVEPSSQLAVLVAGGNDRAERTGASPAP